ncbi:sulfur carrier protein ThiS adenylyltransferase ThiF [Hespellia stercorisuis]|uniref:Sulfur carrier protein ThiS adenylyltransferase n=1 Tax=Hespellia stercorisuis DSM 15480 TaxID=1121950 RepID=A0A1M6QZ30_9FIRM|nr:sulfur carrier protein ThiS adenylyltransferase ThiF [Hespellia stercorisuis]SHK25485.1 sulfur carrier protein ThiS adenylyltransferase [Hespellia stercorisuis DSM 15480]
MIPTRDEVYETLCVRHTRAVQEKLAAGRVAVAGLGGLGSTVAVALARAGVGQLHLIDFDRVDLSNLNRQQYRMKDIGRYKTEALREIIGEINPYLKIETDTVKITAENAKALFTEEDIICEAFDQAVEKAMLTDVFFEELSREKMLVAASGMAGFNSSNLIRTRKVNSRFYLCGDETNGLESGGSLMAPRVGVCAAHEANMILRILVGEAEA